MSRKKSSSTGTALWLASALCLLSGCASTTAAVVERPATCPKPAQPDPRLLEDPLPFTELPDAAVSDSDSISIITQNNLGAKQNHDRYVELIRWIKGRAQ